MFRNYLVTALRNISRYKLYSFINIAGLTMGLACSIFVLLFLRDELSWDRWIPGSENLYGVESTFQLPGKTDHDFFVVTPFPVTPTMQADFPEVVAQTHILSYTMTAQIGDRDFPVTVDAVDPNFLQVIQLALVAGNPATALSKPESLLLSQTTARKFFGTANPLGKTVTLGGTHALVVTGILRDLPHNTHLVADLVMPNTSAADTFPIPARASWLNVQGRGYIKLEPHADPDALARKLPSMLDKNIDAKKMMNLNIKGSDILQLHLTPFRDIHLAPFGESERGHPARIYTFSAIAVLLLLIACFNYMNLATARAMVRAREIALRKVLGARRRQLIAQFMGESLLTALVALVLALAIVQLLLPAYDSFLARPIAFNLLTDWQLTCGVVGTAFVAGILGGIYPALLLSGLRPAARLGTAVSGVGGSGLLRMALVVLQFAISIGLGIAMIVMFAQIRYARQTDLGFDRHDLVVIDGSGPVKPVMRDSIRQALAAEPSIAGVSQSNMTPFDGGKLVQNVTLPQRAQQFVVRNVNIDPDFVKVYHMKLLAGRNLERGRALDALQPTDPKNPPAVREYNVLINAAAARQFGFTPGEALGHYLNTQNNGRLNIVGVVGDANFDGMDAAMPPIFFFYAPLGTGTTTVRIKPGRTQEAIAAIDRVWHRFVPTTAISRRFLDDRFEKQFADDEREDAVFALFVGIAIFIACLGLFGLASFIAQRRTREIGIRKVYGAKTRNIVWLLLWQFSIPVLLANVIAWPIAWYYLRDWLQAYAYRIDLNPLYFLAAGLIALAIAWATVVVQTVLTARANPIKALRYE